ncbi:MAG: T9SS type A sorting domain-containing protein [Ignavibacteria bacterium]|nr:T9SS type A sorting domain-containing protein [Ignavibacteria bacterium]
MRYLVIVVFLTQAAVCQTFDLLTDFEAGKRITFSFIREGVAGTYCGPSDRYTEFRGSVDITTDSVTFSPAASARIYHLSVRQTGIETIKAPGGIVSTRDVDTVLTTAIDEYTTVNHRTGEHRLRGWIFPDTVGASTLCPHEPDTNFFYHYPYYFRLYGSPATDTLDVRADTLLLRHRITDCLDNSIRWDFRFTETGGLVSCETRTFNYFGWSENERYIKTSVTAVPLTPRMADTHILYPNYPNPVSAAANRTTRIAYRLAGAGFATVRVSDLLGRTMRVLSDGYQSAGTHEVLFDVGRLPRGVYVYSLVSGDFFQSRTFLLLE